MLIYILAILLAGCTSSGLSNVYLLSLSYTNNILSSPDPIQINPNMPTIFENLVIPTNDTVTPDLEVRVGYLGMCLREPSISAERWLCSTNTETLVDSIRDGDGAGARDPLNIIWIANNFKGHIIFSGLT